jgi:hypothetical protein
MMAREPILIYEAAKLAEQLALEPPADRLARLSEEVAVDPPYVDRLAKADIHGDYLEHAHESVVRSLATIHMRQARGDHAAATELVAKLRRHLDSLWDQRREVAVRGVAA